MTDYNALRFWRGDPGTVSVHGSVGGEAASSRHHLQPRLSGCQSRSADPGDYRSGADATGVRGGAHSGLANCRVAEALRLKTRDHYD